MASAEQKAETKVTGYTLELSPDEAGVLLAVLAGQVAGARTGRGEPLANIRDALRSAAVEPVALHNANIYRPKEKRGAWAILSRAAVGDLPF